MLPHLLRVSPFLFLLGGQGRFEFTEVHMGMPVRIVLYANTDSEARSAARAAFRRVAELDNTFSDYHPQSEVRRLDQTHVLADAALFHHGYVAVVCAAPIGLRMLARAPPMFLLS